MPPPEGERHSHDYRLELVASRHELDARGMVVDLDVLDGALQDLTKRLDGADLDVVVGPEIGTDAVTVEAFAKWLHGKVATAIGPVTGVTLAIRVWESPTAFGGYRGHTDGPNGAA